MTNKLRTRLAARQFASASDVTHVLWLVMGRLGYVPAKGSWISRVIYLLRHASGLITAGTATLYWDTKRARCCQLARLKVIRYLVV